MNFSSRREFLQGSGLAAAMSASPSLSPAEAGAPFIVDCQSHLSFVEAPEAMRFALDFSGPDKLLFSSDHPWAQPHEVLDPLRSLKLPAATEAKILGGNAKALFNL